MKRLSFVMTEEMQNKYFHRVSPNVTVIGLIDEEELIGYVEYRDDEDNELFIEMISTRVPYRKMGYSTILLEKMLELHPVTLAFTGESTDEALDYWKAKGAIFHPGVSPADMESEEMEFKGNLHAFSLKIHEDSNYIPYWEAVSMTA